MLSNAPLRVGYVNSPYEPFRFNCSSAEGFDLGENNCTFPGIHREILGFILEYLNLTAEPVAIPDIGDGRVFANMAEAMGDSIDLDAEQHYMLKIMRANLTATRQITTQYMAAMVSNTPIRIGPNPLNFLHPFQWPLWLLLALCVLLNKVLSQLYVVLFYSDIRRFRPSYSASVLPLTFGVMLLGSLYKSGLLTKLLLSEAAYLINELSDFGGLPEHVKIFSTHSKWSFLMEVAEGDLRRKMALMPVIHTKAISEEVVEIVQRNAGVYIGYEAVILHVAQSCSDELRVVRLGQRPYSFMFNTSTEKQRTLLDLFDQVILEMPGMWQNTQDRYLRHVPVHRHCLQTTEAGASGIPSLRLMEVSGMFMLLVAGSTISALWLCGETLGCGQKVRTQCGSPGP